MKYLTEEDFTEMWVKPWLKKKGYSISSTHGTSEHGKDLVITKGKGEKFGACLIKPKIHGSYDKEGNIEEVKNKALAAFSVPYKDHRTKKSRKIEFLWIISNYKITSEAKENIISSLGNHREIEFFNGEDILQEFNELELSLKHIEITLTFKFKECDIKKLKIFSKKIGGELREISESDKNNFSFIRTQNSGEIEEIKIFVNVNSLKEFKNLNKLFGELGYNSKLDIKIIFEGPEKLSRIEDFISTYLKDRGYCSNGSNAGVCVYYDFPLDKQRFISFTKLIETWF